METCLETGNAPSVYLIEEATGSKPVAPIKTLKRLLWKSEKGDKYPHRMIPALMLSFIYHTGHAEGLTSIIHLLD